MPVGMMLKNIDSRELSEWQAYFVIFNEEIKKEVKEQPKADETRLLEANIQSGLMQANAYAKAKKRR